MTRTALSYEICLSILLLRNVHVSSWVIVIVLLSHNSGYVDRGVVSSSERDDDIDENDDNDSDIHDK